MSEFAIMLALQLGAMLLMGMPVALALAAQDRSSDCFGWLLLAPAFGVTLYLGLATGLHFLGLGSSSIVPVLFSSTCLFSAVILVRFTGPRDIGRLLVGLILIAAGAVAVVALDTIDIRSVGLDDYFPLTNADTFVVLGNVDRIRTFGWSEVRPHYPAGFTLHNELYRAPGTVLVADFADILGLKPHAAFFLTQRLALPVIVLASTGIVVLLCGSVVAAAVCFTVLALGNFLLHQVLQQFNASAMGSMLAPVILALAIWTVRDGRTRSEFLAGMAGIGFASGTLAMASPESLPFYLLVLAAIFLPLLAARRQIRLFGAALIIFLAAAIVVASPVALDQWRDVISEYHLAAHGHPGDWVAVPAFVIQAAGLTLLTSDRFSDFPGAVRLASLGFVLVFGFAFAALAYSAAKRPSVGRLRHSDLLALFSSTLVMLSLQAFLYMRGMGYGLLKFTDYFAFLPSIVVSVGLISFGLTSRSVILRALTSLFLIGACIAYGAVAVPEKHRLLHKYRDIAREMPPPAAYRLEAPGIKASALVVPDLRGAPLQLFLYENRWGANRIAFEADESLYFVPLPASGGNDGWMARFPRVGIAGLPLADITYGVSRGAGTHVEVLPLFGQIHIRDGGGWLDPEGDRPEELWRWLSGHGAFTVYGGSAQGLRALDFELQPGPDLRPDNLIDIAIEGHVLATVTPKELPRHMVLPLPASSLFALGGEIVIRGPTSGLRQVRVGHLKTREAGK
ncbi:MAG: hypothetical protein ACLQME_22160 [Alphaproteobacteria bacterium]